MIPKPKYFPNNPLLDRRLNLRTAMQLVFFRWRRLYIKQKKAYIKRARDYEHTGFSFFTRRAINVYRAQLGDTMPPEKIIVSGICPHDKIKWISKREANY